MTTRMVFSYRDAETIIHTQTKLDPHRRIDPQVAPRGCGIHVYDEAG